ncbi:MAG: type IV toxin-antitoxin system AbiEi family antitoxin domain-containing protein [Actinomycetales bacterium]|uniref:Type IV toxin-antitoxin system AbiEi family antitoxin domain-containing protein n=1 Tax=Candidatus Phosphoribacter hodrii TaxID=2953743 RepID=A0A935MGW3_9MICO|nr:type IV toxin-antitoxin system AbiEi family antitoxin domain-containing protein [Candidatus Phosphoribacter hodrii]
MTIRDQVLERAVAQHGYVTTRDARELGIDPTQLRLMAARGRRAGPTCCRGPRSRTEHDEFHLTVPRDNHPRGAGGDLYRLHRSSG